MTFQTSFRRHMRRRGLARHMAMQGKVEEVV